MKLKMDKKSEKNSKRSAIAPGFQKVAEMIAKKSGKKKDDK